MRKKFVNATGGVRRQTLRMRLAESPWLPIDDLEGHRNFSSGKRDSHDGGLWWWVVNSPHPVCKMGRPASTAEVWTLRWWARLGIRGRIRS